MGAVVAVAAVAAVAAVPVAGCVAIAGAGEVVVLGVFGTRTVAGGVLSLLRLRSSTSTLFFFRGDVLFGEVVEWERDRLFVGAATLGGFMFC